MTHEETASQETTGPFAIAIKTRIGVLRRIPDTKFDTFEAAVAYGLKYHTNQYGHRAFEVVPHKSAPRPAQRRDEDSTYRQQMKDAGRGHLLR